MDESEYLDESCHSCEHVYSRILSANAFGCSSSVHACVYTHVVLFMCVCNSALFTFVCKHTRCCGCYRVGVIQQLACVRANTRDIVHVCR